MNHNWVDTVRRFVAVTAALLLGLGCAMAPAQAAPLRAIEDFNILLGRPTDDAITASVIPDQSGEISFEYGTASGVYGSQTDAISCTADEPVEVVIDGLASNTRYYYRLRFRATGGDPWISGGEDSFHTQRAPGSTFTFTIISDSHMSGGGGNVSLYEQTSENVGEDNPDFHFDLGDTAWTDGVTTASAANQRYLAQRQWLASWTVRSYHTAQIDREHSQCRQEDHGIQGHGMASEGFGLLLEIRKVKPL